MRAIKKEDLENINYYQVPKWLMDLFIDGKISQGGFKTYVLMYDRLRLSSKKGWIDKNDEVYIRYSYDEMQSDLNCSRQTVSNNLKDLEKLELIDKKRGFNSSTIFYLNIYSISLENFTSKEEFTSKKNLDDCESRNIDYSSLENLDSSKNNFSKNNFKKIMTHEEHEFFENLFKTIGVNFTTTNQKSVKKLLKTLNKNQVEEYLLETYENMKTNPNIENLEGAFSIKIMTGERQSKYKDSVIDIPKIEIESQEKKEFVRGHKFNSEAIDSTIEAKEAKEEYTAKIDRLQGTYQVLSDTEKKKIDDEAYQLAVEQYGPAVAKVMARTKTKFEILEKYYLLEKGA